MITTRHVHASKVWGIPQFWLVWLVLCLNVTAGIGILGMASPLLQEIFGGQLLGVQLSFNELDTAQKAQIAAIAAGFTGLLSLFNIGGRFVWASCSDYLGRKMTYGIFFVLGLGCMRRFRRWRMAATWRCSWASSASSCRCTAAALPPCRPTWPTCSAPRWWAPSTAAC
jgi:MFS family permease